MAQLDRIASHEGVVKNIKDGVVNVEIESVSACASCQAHSRCGFAESKNKMVEIPTKEWNRYSEGETVQVHIDEQHGLLAVWIAYIVPAILMLAVIITLSLVGFSEGIVIAITMVCIVLYVGILYLIRNRINNKFILSVEKC